jgi:PAS domain S-box-containing protein
VSLDPEIIHAQRFEEIGRIIERDADVLIDRWARRAIQEQPQAEPTHRGEMRDDLPAFLRAIGQWLASTDAYEPGPHQLIAVKHGEQRWRVGWELPDVVADYRILRLVILDYLEDKLERPLEVREVMAVGLVLDEAISAAVQRYVRFQHEHNRALDARARAVLDNTVDGIITLNKDGRIVTVNSAGSMMFGSTDVGLVGENIRTLIPGLDGELDRTSTAAGNRREAIARKKNGSEFLVDVSISRVQFDGQEILTTILRDVTERKRQESELQRYATELEAVNRALEDVSAAAENANRAKSDFLASMSHEIRTPMTAILGFTDMLLETASDSASREAVQTIKRNGEFLLEIINDILDLSKIEAARLEIEHVACDPISILEDLRSLMQVRADAKGLAFEVCYDGVIPESIQSDAMRLRQILVNLVGNAIKFTDEGSVRLVTRLVKDDATPRLEFEVTDTGIGMAPQEIARVFEPFAQAKTSTTRCFGGSGLGLSITKRLVELLGGRITVESNPGRGSRFVASIATGDLSGVRFVDPASATASAVNDGSSTKMPRAKVQQLDCRVLVADDRRDNQLLITRMLEKTGARVTAVGDGLSVLDVVLGKDVPRQEFDVILLDMQMPELDGYSTARQLRSTGCKVPIVALTASAMKGDREKCLAAGCDDYLPKPIHYERLLEVIGQYCR